MINFLLIIQPAAAAWQALPCEGLATHACRTTTQCCTCNIAHMMGSEPSTNLNRSWHDAFSHVDKTTRHAMQARQYAQRGAMQNCTVMRERCKTCCTVLAYSTAACSTGGCILYPRDSECATPHRNNSMDECSRNSAAN
jgi:hypothetical protein